LVKIEAPSVANSGKTLNANEGYGEVVRIAYKTERGWGNPYAIAEVRVVDAQGRSLSVMEDKIAAQNPSVGGYKKWETLDVPFGKGINGVFYLQYRRGDKNDKDDTLAIDSIGCYYNPDKTLKAGVLDAFPGREFVHGYYSSLVTSLAMSGPYYYLTVHKAPFKW
jgi:hypothetical protein